MTYALHIVASDWVALTSLQKCSAQSIMFMHKNWSSTSLLSTMKSLASRRNLQDLTVASVLSHTTEEMLSHTQACLELPGQYWAASPVPCPVP